MWHKCIIFKLYTTELSLKQIVQNEGVTGKYFKTKRQTWHPNNFILLELQDFISNLF